MSETSLKAFYLLGSGVQRDSTRRVRHYGTSSEHRTIPKDEDALGSDADGSAPSTKVSSKTSPAVSSQSSLTSASASDQVDEVPTLHAIDNARIHRMPFAETFLRDLLGINALECMDLTPIQSLYSRLITPSREPIGATYEALALLALGTATTDPAVILEARKAHLGSIQRLRRDLERTGRRVKLNEALSIVARAYALLACEVYNNISSGIIAWDIQLPGILALLSPSIPIPNTIFRALRHITLMRSYVLRRPAVWNDRIWNSDTTSVDPGSIEKLLRLALRLPPLLRKVHSSLEPISDLRAQLQSLQTALVSWLSEYHEHTQKHPPPSRPRGSSADITVPAHYIQYMSILSASVHAFYMITMLLLREALYDLSETEDPSLLAEAGRYADLLYRSVPYLNEAAAGGQLSRANSVGAALYFSTRWYEKVGHAEKVQKCRALEKWVFDRELGAFDRETTLPWSLVVLCYLD